MRRMAMTAAVMLGLAGCATPQASEPDISDFLSLMGGVGPAESGRIARGLADKPLGSAQNPVRAYMPPGQRAHLSRLRCANGQRPSFERMSSAGDSPYGSIMDVYRVECVASSPASSDIYIDMYHAGHVEAAAVPGFSIKP